MCSIIKEFCGHSGSKIYLMKNENRMFVRKYDNIKRNLERYSCLSESGIVFPVIYDQCESFYDMEYVGNMNMSLFISIHGIDRLHNFLLNFISKLVSFSVKKDYTEVFQRKLSLVDWSLFSFNEAQLLKKLPKIHGTSLYHGDLTLDNILYDNIYDRFVLIDPITSEYDSYVFDLCKLNQDIRCYWFHKNLENSIKNEIDCLYAGLCKKHPVIEDNYLTIAMLLRVLAYCKTDFEKKYLVEQVEILWKS